MSSLTKETHLRSLASMPACEKVKIKFQQNQRELCAYCADFFNLYAFMLLVSTVVPGINYFVVITHPLHQLQVRRRSCSSCYMMERYNTRHRFPCY